MNLGDSIRKLRQTKGFSQGEMQKRTGILRSYLSRVENGHTIPSLATLKCLTEMVEKHVITREIARESAKIPDNF